MSTAVTATPSVGAAKGPIGRVRLLVVAALIAALAVAARLYPVLRGGGLFGLGNYDDGVHYSATAALMAGKLPYRDFLLLHPPGILLLLAPFAGLGRVLGDPDGMMLARVSWLVLGAANALLAGRLMLRVSAAAAVVAGVAYALFYPAIYSEQTILLEAPATACLLLALVLLRATEPRAVVPARWLVLAGVFLGFTVTIKIWGVVPVAVVAVWLLVVRGRRPAWQFLAGAVGCAFVVCLPLFLVAPSAMWRMVVVDQVGRRALPVPFASRLIDLSGMALFEPSSPRVTPLVLVALVAVVGALVVAAIDARTRLLAAVLAALLVLLLLTPSWFIHYSALTAAPIVLCAAVVAHHALRLASRVGRWGPVAVVVLIALVGVAYGQQLLNSSFGRSFPGAALGRALADRPGCVATDDPSTLIQTNLLRRNLDRGCRVEIDLGGVNYDIDHPTGDQVSRARNPIWQAYCLAYYRASDAVISVRFSAGYGYSKDTARVYASWPQVVKIGRYVVRAPRP